jgi:hypothetical protein
MNRSEVCWDTAGRRKELPRRAILIRIGKALYGLDNAAAHCSDNCVSEFCRYDDLDTGAIVAMSFEKERGIRELVTTNRIKLTG